MKEHKKDAYKKYFLIYIFYSVVQVENELKKFGVTKFMGLSEIDKFKILNSFVIIKSLKRSSKSFDSHLSVRCTEKCL